MNFYSPFASLISPAPALSNLSFAQPGAVLQPAGRHAHSIARSFLFSNTLLTNFCDLPPVGARFTTGSGNLKPRGSKLTPGGLNSAPDGGAFPPDSASLQPGGGTLPPDGANFPPRGGKPISPRFSSKTHFLTLKP